MKVMTVGGRKARLRGASVLTYIIFVTFITSITSPSSHAETVEYPDVVPGYTIRFPADEGSHPEFRTEWWYITGWLTDDHGVQRGFQVTFFRSRLGLDEDNPSRFTAKQLLFAHAAISDPSRGKLMHAERSARAGFGLAEASEGRLAVHIDDWFLRQEEGVYRSVIAAERFAIDLTFRAEQPPLLQGENGYSQKGPDPKSASYYYSLPHLRASGEVHIEGRRHEVTGIAWFDHEWSSQLLDEAAVGWDWIGLNLDDGGAVAAAQIRDKHGNEHWAAGSWRTSPLAPVLSFSPQQVSWLPGRRWRSSRTEIEYPVEWRIALGDRTLLIKPLMDDQENDARGSTGSIYWEGAVRAFDERGAQVGKGYLELTGYGPK